MAQQDNSIRFYLNMKEVTIKDPSPDLMLIDYLRQPDVNLTGPKKPCGQGGCGSCTVILSHWDEDLAKPRHEAINACLRPVCALNGLSITTIEGTGSVGGVMNPVAYRLAVNNGTQCGYCTNGWVMNMTAFLASHPESGTKKEIEGLFDGNLCRCTGYRAILTGMKSFATDWSEEDEKAAMKCKIDQAFDPKSVGKTVSIPFPEEAKSPVEPARVDKGSKQWISVTSIDDLQALYLENPGAVIRLVHGNTSFGIYKQEMLAADILADIRPLQELHGIDHGPDGLSFGAATLYSDLIPTLTELAGENGTSIQPGNSIWAGLSYMAKRTAGHLVRNAATIAGNSMLVLKHIHEGEPFPSDMATALCGAGADIEILQLETGERERLPLSDLMINCRENPDLAGKILLIRYHVPTPGDRELGMAHKVALREVNSHSIVNAMTSFPLTEAGTPAITDCRLVLGGIAPYAWRANRTEDWLNGQPLSMDIIGEACRILDGEVRECLDHWADRMQGLPDEGFSNSYRTRLACSYLYKSLVNALLITDPDQVPADIASSGINLWGRWPVSDGRQSYQTDLYPAPLSEPYIKLMAMYQAQGEVKYTHEMALPPTALFGALVQSARALSSFEYTLPNGTPCPNLHDLEQELARRFEGFNALITATDIPPGGANMQGSGADEALFATEHVTFEGQPLAMVLATEEIQAQAIAAFIEECCLRYEEEQLPILTIEEAISRESIFPDCPQSAPFLAHIWKVTRPNSDFSWVREKSPLDKEIEVREASLDGADCLVVEGTQKTGAQLHFYMETQSAIARPRDDGTIEITSSTQSPTTVHDTVCSAIDYSRNMVGIKVRQLGGGYGGKTDQSRFVPAQAAVGALKTGRPVKLALSRESDSAFIGRRHPYYGQYQFALDTGHKDPADKGLIRGTHAKLWGDGGAMYDCSFVVSDCIQLRVDNAYYVPNYETQIDVCRTNKAPNTAYRAFGDIQGTLILENAIEDAAVALEMEPEDIREKNLYQIGQTTPGGQGLLYCYQREVWDYAKQKSDFAERKAIVDDFNAENKWRKRGICLMPLKYGSGYNLVMLEQTSAMVNVFSGDGTVLIRQGGVDMGQGMMTKVVQIAAYELNVPLEIIRIDSSDTDVIPNPQSTGASTGTQYNGEAVRQACRVLQARLQAFGYQMLKENGPDWCKEKQINFWDYGIEGWKTPVGDGNRPVTIWQKLVSLAYQMRVNLQAQVNAQMPGGIGPVPNIAFKPKQDQPTGTGITIDPNGAFSETVNQYVGFTYNAACSEVEVDILTGETKILRSDIYYDMGKSLNPAIDVGQIEGAFVQGIGYVLTEDLVFQPEGENAGRLNTVNTWRYKPPAITTIPLEMNVHLFPRELAAHVPENPNTLFSSKEVGEPPLVLANTVFFALKRAIRTSRIDRGLSPYFDLDAPATVQAVQTACEVDHH
ncbi:molybdopterin cofactor-binding domain-containing protein [Aestuariispira insulae]|uniref:Xanthine dehydrogenase/oxidase n=1 Tax=Aestuariispira insulae TaxID=1461337 RepID=A0A3D9HGC0_9PROT|nr:molybdopterin cofactor-binding domain-containing protein [Aestuariispira insulae]RED48528.1 xanthine dehydrogenase/oxidase [Aestuariispira insulae]